MGYASHTKFSRVQKLVLDMPNIGEKQQKYTKQLNKRKFWLKITKHQTKIK